MKFLLLSFFISVTAFAGSRSISIDEVSRYVSDQNFTVYENALKVYQAKTNIEKARLDLLPRLSIWTIAKIAINPTAALDAIKDIAPYLVPANWFRVEQTQLLFLASREGYRALWANEIHSAKALYHHLLFDYALLNQIRSSQEELKHIHLIAQTHEMFGGAPPGTAREIEIKILGLKEDERGVKALVMEEMRALSYAMGLPSSSDMKLAPVVQPNFMQLPPLRYEDYEFRALANSPERRQQDHFISALAQVRNEIYFSFLGASNISRGVAGGVFDNLPAPDGLGFGQGPALRIVRGQEQIFLNQKRGIEETIRRHLGLLVDTYNLDLGQYGDTARRVELFRAAKAQITNRIKLGERINILELADITRDQIQSETSLLALRSRIMVSEDKLNRLIFDKDYAQEPKYIDDVDGRRQ